MSERLVCQLFSPFKKETVNVFLLGQFLFFKSAQAYMSEEWDVLLVILRRQCSSKLYRRREEVIKRAFSKKNSKLSLRTAGGIIPHLDTDMKIYCMVYP